MKTDLSKKIIVPANVCPIVIAIFLKAGKKVELVDISPDNYHIDQNKVLELNKFNENTYDSLLFVRTYGAKGDFNNFFADVKKSNNDMLVIDDSCLCVPDFNEPKVADFKLFSTGYSKIVELGFGGYAITKNDNYNYEREYLNYKEKDHKNLVKKFNKTLNECSDFIYNDTGWLDSRKPDISQNKYFETIKSKIIESKKHKAKINSIYTNNLPSEIFLGKEFNNWRFNILVNNKEEILSYIFKNDLFASSHYKSASLFLNNSRMPVTEKLSDQVINLFNDYRFDEKMAFEVSKIIIDHI